MVHWHKGPGEPVAAGDIIAVVETVKLEAPVVAPGPGTLQQVAVADFADIEGGAVLARIAATEDKGE